MAKRSPVPVAERVFDLSMVAKRYKFCGNWHRLLLSRQGHSGGSGTPRASEAAPHETESVAEGWTRENPDEKVAMTYTLVQRTINMCALMTFDSPFSSLQRRQSSGTIQHTASCVPSSSSLYNVSWVRKRCA